MRFDVMTAKLKAAMSLNGIKGILWILIGIIFLIYQPLGAPLGWGFSVVGLLILIIGIVSVLQIIGVFSSE